MALKQGNDITVNTLLHPQNARREQPQEPETTTATEKPKYIRSLAEKENRPTKKVNILLWADQYPALQELKWKVHKSANEIIRDLIDEYIEAHRDSGENP